MFSKLNFSLRILKKNKLLLAVNVIGLSVGLAVCLLLGVYLNHELSYDKHFKNSERMARLITVWNENNRAEYYPISLRSAYTEIPVQEPVVESAVQFYRNWNTQLKADEQVFGNVEMLYVDTTFFDVFQDAFICGNTYSPFQGASSIVITQSLANKIFNSSNPLGKVLTIDGTAYAVSAVVADFPENSHFHFQVLIPMQAVENLIYLQGLEFFTYYLLAPNTSLADASQKITTAYNQILKDGFSEFNASFDSYLEPLEQIHMFTRAGFDLSAVGSVKQVILVALIAITILFMAIFNCINLYIVYGQNRAKEMGIRRVSGATVRNIKQQMLGEAFLLNFVALIMALILVYLLLPYFSSIIQRSLKFTSVISGAGLLTMGVILLVSSLLSGIYPSLVIARYNNIEILKGDVSKGALHPKLASSIIIGQFAMVVLLIYSLVAIQGQLNFLRKTLLGFNPHQIVTFSNFNRNLYEHGQALEKELAAIPGVQQVAFSLHTMGSGASGQGARLYGSSADTDMAVDEYRVFPGFCQLFELHLVWGHFFNPDDLGKEDVVILNKTAADRLGVDETTHNQIDMFGFLMRVIGVVDDFYYRGAAEKVQPLVLACRQANFWNINLRVNKNTGLPLRNQIVALIQKYDPDYIPSYYFMDEKFDNFYANEKRIVKIVGFGGFVAVLISLMGLFALTIFNLQKRTKELGVRKVLGASSLKIASLVLFNMGKWLLVATLIAWPLAVILMNRWLSSYPMRTGLSPNYFILSALIPIVLTLLTIGWHVLKVAFRNPVESLRYE